MRRLIDLAKSKLFAANLDLGRHRHSGDLDCNSVKIRGRTYDLGHGFELLAPPGFKAAAHRLAIMRAAATLGLKVPKLGESDLI